MCPKAPQGLRRRPAQGYPAQHRPKIPSRATNVKDVELVIDSGSLEQLLLENQCVLTNSMKSLPVLLKI